MQQWLQEATPCSLVLCPFLPPWLSVLYVSVSVPACSNTQAIIYVVDSCDADRLPTSREEFQAILEEEELKEAAILVYANKQVGCLALWC